MPAFNSISACSKWNGAGDAIMARFAPEAAAVDNESNLLVALVSYIPSSRPEAETHPTSASGIS
jgi:hypothetical protein